MKINHRVTRVTWRSSRYTVRRHVRVQLRCKSNLKAIRILGKHYVGRIIYLWFFINDGAETRIPNESIDDRAHPSIGPLVAQRQQKERNINRKDRTRSRERNSRRNLRCAASSKYAVRAWQESKIPNSRLTLVYTRCSFVRGKLTEKYANSVVPSEQLDSWKDRVAIESDTPKHIDVLYLPRESDYIFTFERKMCRTQNVRLFGVCACVCVCIRVILSDVNYSYRGQRELSIRQTVKRFSELFCGFNLWLINYRPTIVFVVSCRWYFFVSWICIALYFSVVIRSTDRNETIYIYTRNIHIYKVTSLSLCEKL